MKTYQIFCLGNSKCRIHNYDDEGSYETDQEGTGQDDIDYDSGEDLND